MRNQIQRQKMKAICLRLQWDFLCWWSIIKAPLESSPAKLWWVSSCKKKQQKNSRRLRSSTNTGDALRKTECVSVPPIVNNDDISWRQNLCNQKAEWWNQRWPTDPPTYQEQSLAGIIINKYLKPKRKNQQSCGLVCWWVHTSPHRWLRLVHLLSVNRWENHVVTDSRPYFCTTDEVSVVTVHRCGTLVNTIIQMRCLGAQLVTCFVVIEQTCQRVAVFCEILNIAMEWPDCTCRW